MERTLTISQDFLNLSFNKIVVKFLVGKLMFILLTFLTITGSYRRAF